jgi:competence ComEA-like helix-hairpin-helix protein
MAAGNSRQIAGEGGARIQSFAFAISVCICVILCVFFLFDFSEGAGADEIRLESRINPNDAPISSLVRLPGIGMSKAAAIVAYREEYRLSGATGAAFRDCNDLQKVRGIGPKTAEAMAKWTVFE